MQCLRHLEVIKRFFRNEKISITSLTPFPILEIMFMPFGLLAPKT
jgi:hypothetical protein